MQTILSPEERKFYEEEGYLHVRSQVPPDALQLARGVLERWVDETIAKWQAQGLVDNPREELDFERRLVVVWNETGRPGYIRSPRRDLVSPEMYAFLTHPALLDIAEELLQSTEISLHGVFNARPKLPDQTWTNTPWHQDAQYYRDAENLHTVTLWLPLQSVNEENSCLQVALRVHRGQLFENYDDAESGFIGLSPEHQKELQAVSVPMEPGDVLCFTQKTPHRALPNKTDRVRWSMDLRFESTPQATDAGKRQGSIARSAKNPQSVTSYEEWLEKWRDIPAGSY